MDMIKRIDELCQKRQISKYRLSQLTGISQSAFSKMSRQQSSLTVENIERICRALGISMAQFFAENNEYPDLTEKQQLLLNHWELLPEPKRDFVIEITERLNQI